MTYEEKLNALQDAFAGVDTLALIHILRRRMDDIPNCKAGDMVSFWLCSALADRHADDTPNLRLSLTRAENSLLNEELEKAKAND